MKNRNQEQQIIKRQPINCYSFTTYHSHLSLPLFLSLFGVSMKTFYLETPCLPRILFIVLLLIRSIYCQRDCFWCSYNMMPSHTASYPLCKYITCLVCTKNLSSKSFEPNTRINDGNKKLLT